MQDGPAQDGQVVVLGQVRREVYDPDLARPERLGGDGLGEPLRAVLGAAALRRVGLQGLRVVRVEDRERGGRTFRLRSPFAAYDVFGSRVFGGFHVLRISLCSLFPARRDRHLADRAGLTGVGLNRPFALRTCRRRGRLLGDDVQDTDLSLRGFLGLGVPLRELLDAEDVEREWRLRVQFDRRRLSPLGLRCR